MPYVYLGITAGVGLLIVGLMLASFKWGQRAQIAKDNAKVAQVAQDVAEAQSRIRDAHPTPDWLREHGKL